jgi:hypothetical protein
VSGVAFWCSSTGQVWTWRYTPFLGVWVVAATFIGGYVLAHRRAGRPLDRRLTRRWILGVLAVFVVSEWPIGQLGVGYLATVGIAGTSSTRSSPHRCCWWAADLAGRPLAPGGTRRAERGRLPHPVAGRAADLQRRAVRHARAHRGRHAQGQPARLLQRRRAAPRGGAGLVVAGDPARAERNAIEEPIRAFYLFASSVLMFVPAAFLTFSPLPLYGLYELAPPLWLGFDAVADQQAAGIVMNVVGGFVLWAIIAVLFIRWAGQQEAEDARMRRERSARVLDAVRTLEAEAGERPRRSERGPEEATERREVASGIDVDGAAVSPARDELEPGRWVPLRDQLGRDLDRHHVVVGPVVGEHRQREVLGVREVVEVPPVDPRRELAVRHDQRGELSGEPLVGGDVLEDAPPLERRCVEDEPDRGRVVGEASGSRPRCRR